MSTTYFDYMFESSNYGLDLGFDYDFINESNDYYNDYNDYFLENEVDDYYNGYYNDYNYFLENEYELSYYTPLNEGVWDNIVNWIKRIINKIINGFNNLKKKVRSYFDSRETKPFNKSGPPAKQIIEKAKEKIDQKTMDQILDAPLSKEELMEYDLKGLVSNNGLDIKQIINIINITSQKTALSDLTTSQKTYEDLKKKIMDNNLTTGEYTLSINSALDAVNMKVSDILDMIDNSIDTCHKIANNFLESTKQHLDNSDDSARSRMKQDITTCVNNLNDLAKKIEISTDIFTEDKILALRKTIRRYRKKKMNKTSKPKNESFMLYW